MSDLFTALISAIVLGLLGSGHCIGMCGGLMGALTIANPKNCKSERIRILLCYNVGRIFSYTVAGFIVGFFGWGISNQGFNESLRFISGLLLIAMGLYLTGWWHGLTYLEKIGRYLWKYIEPNARKLIPVRSFHQAFLLGSLWGWLPCGLIYSTLLWAGSQGNSYESALLMLFFGLGTLPTLLVTGIAATRISNFIRKRAFRLSSGLLVIFFGLWTLPGPHQSIMMGH